MIRCIIVDDEPMAISVLRSHAAKLSFLRIESAFYSATEALAFLQTQKTDLVFMDIEMPDLSGIELARVLGDSVKIIFTTAYPQYAIAGFELAVTDYLLKPVSFDRFSIACNRVRESLSLPDEKFIFVKTGYDWVRIDLDSLLYLEAEDNYVTFYEACRKTLCRMTLREAMEKLPPGKFLRIHKSYVVAVFRVDKIERGQVMVGGRYLPVSATFREVLMKQVTGSQG